MNTRIFVWINDRMYTTGSFKEAVMFASMFNAKIGGASKAYAKDKLSYCE